MTRGTVERLPSGRFRARRLDPVTRRYVPLGTHDTEAAAWAALDPARKPAELPGTLASFGAGWLVRRRSELRSWPKEENRWRLYVERLPLGAMELRAIRRPHVKDWLRELATMGLSAQTRRNALTLVRVCLEDALDRELVSENAARTVRLPRGADAREDETWTVLYPDEQLDLLNTVSEDEWHTIAFALQTGLRPGEQWALKLADIDLDERLVTVRSASNGPTKSGRIRRVPLFGVAMEAAREAVEHQKRGCPWAFPAPRTNARRAAEHVPSAWHRWITAAKIGRRVRYYDLRHTCATGLLAGWWGRKWSLDEVRQMLGHSSTKVTERYAHLLDETLARAGAGTGFHAELSKRENQGANCGIRTHDLRFTNPRLLEGFSGLAVEDFHRRSTERERAQAANLIEATRLAYRMGTDPLAKARVREILEEEACTHG